MNAIDLSHSLAVFAKYDPNAVVTYANGFLYVIAAVTDMTDVGVIMNYGWELVPMENVTILVWKHSIIRD